MSRVVLAYSGGARSADAIERLARDGAEVVTLTLDIGQDLELAPVRERALALGAVRAHVIDVREEFGREFVLPALQAGVFSTERLRLATALPWPLVARRLMDVARMESASAVAHGGRAGAPAEVALHAALRSLAGSLEVIAMGRLAGAAPPFPVENSRFDGNLWGRVVHVTAGGDAEHAFRLTCAPDEGPASPATVDIEFVSAVPVRTNGVEMPLLEMIESLETIAGAHGVGRAAAAPEDAAHVAYAEAPAAVVLHTALAHLEAHALGPDLGAVKRAMAGIYGGLVERGDWHGELRESIDAFVRLLAPRLTGSVRLRLSKGQCTVVECRLPHPSSRVTPDPRAVA